MTRRNYLLHAGSCLLLAQADCQRKEAGQKSMSEWRGSVKPEISEKEAIKIASQDGVKAYGDLSAFEPTAVLMDDGWHVDFDFKDKRPTVAGGGPEYLIDAKTGAILKKLYHQ